MKKDKEEIAKIHNLTVKIRESFFNKDTKSLHLAADEIFHSGYELEQMRLTPTVRKLVEQVLYQTGWVPMPVEFKQ